ncbi:MAG: DMT family transporter [bacterium]
MATRPLATLAVGAVCISFAAIFVKLIDPAAMGPTGIGFWRAGMGAAVLFAWSFAAGERLRLPPGLLAWTVLAGFVFYLDLFFWHRSIVFSGAGMATILAATQVFVTATLGRFLFSERLTWRLILAAVSGVVGVALLVGIGSGVEFTPRYAAGIVYGLVTGIAYGSYIVILKNVGLRSPRLDFRVVLAWTSTFTAVFMGLSGWLEGDTLVVPDITSGLVLFGLALTAQVLGWWIISTTMPKLKTAHGSLILLLQPVLATVWGFLIFHEVLTALQIVGAVVTLAAIYAGSVRRSH